MKRFLEVVGYVVGFTLVVAFAVGSWALLAYIVKLIWNA